MVRRTPSGIYRSQNAAILPKSGGMFMLDSNPRSTYYEEQSAIPPYVEETRKDFYMLINGNKIIPNGANNLFPQDLKRLLDRDNDMHGLLRTKIDLLLSGGWFLYQERLEKDEKGHTKLVKDEVLDPEISDYLESYDFDNYLAEAATDMIYVENNTPVFRRNVYSRSNLFREKWRLFPMLIGAEDSRLEAYDDNNRINHIFAADWTDPESSRNPTKIPMVNFDDPFSQPISAKFICFPSFASKYYGRPPYIGAVNYIELATLIPYWHKDNIKNAAFNWIVSTSFDYWQKMYEENNISAGSKEAVELEDEILAEIDSILYSETAENAQKRIHTKFSYSADGKPLPSITITPLQDNTTERSSAYTELFKIVNQAKISGVHLDPTLANTVIDGKLSSGSEKMHAFNLHNKVVTPMPRRLILWAPNFALKHSFPDKNIKIGFREIELVTQDNTTKGTKEPEQK